MDETKEKKTRPNAHKLSPEQWDVVEELYRQGRTASQLLLYILNTWGVKISASTIYHRVSTYGWGRENRQDPIMSPAVTLAHATDLPLELTSDLMRVGIKAFAKHGVTKLQSTLEVILDTYANEMVFQDANNSAQLQQMATLQAMITKTIDQLLDLAQKADPEDRIDTKMYQDGGVMVVGVIPTVDEFELLAAQQQDKLKAEVKNIPQRGLDDEQTQVIINAADALNALLPQLRSGAGTYQEMADDIEPVAKLATKLREVNYE